jgi:Zn-dependent protease
MSGAAPGLANNPTLTPILDRLIPIPLRPKKSKKATAVQLTVGAVIGGILSFVAIFQAERHDSGSLTALVSLFYFYASLYLGIIVHETGHLLAGISAGYRVNFIRIGPFQINPPFRVTKQPKLGIGAAGLASLMPGKSKNPYSSGAWMIFGGPLANLISGSALLLLPRPLPIFVVWFIGVAFVLGIGNLIPFARIGAVSDGRRIFDVLRRTPKGERWLAISQLTSDMWDGVLPINFDQEMLQKATAVLDEWPDTVAGHILAYSAAFDAHKHAEAARLLEVALQYSAFTAFTAKEAVQIEAAVFQTRGNARIDLAEQWLADLPNKPLTPGLRGFAEAAILEARLEFDAALMKLSESEKSFRRMPEGFQRDCLLASLARRVEEIESKAAALAPSQM